MGQTAGNHKTTGSQILTPGPGIISASTGHAAAAHHGDLGKMEIFNIAAQIQQPRSTHNLP